MIGDNGTYCNTTELNIAIRVDDLQCVISEKSIGENKAFLSEYKVFGNNRLQRTIDLYKYALQRGIQKLEIYSIFVIHYSNSKYNFVVGSLFKLQ